LPEEWEKQIWPILRGGFVWRDLITTDIEVAKKLYAGLLAMTRIPFIVGGL
jgi:hypothetical protein